MAIIISNRGRPAYGVKRLMVRTVEELLNIPLAPTLISPGSTVFVSSTQTKYLLDQDYNWVQAGGTGDTEPVVEPVIYEGGDIESGEVEDDSIDYEGGDIS